MHPHWLLALHVHIAFVPHFSASVAGVHVAVQKCASGSPIFEHSGAVVSVQSESLSQNRPMPSSLPVSPGFPQIVWNASAGAASIDEPPSSPQAELTTISASASIPLMRAGVSCSPSVLNEKFRKGPFMSTPLVAQSCAQLAFVAALCACTPAPRSPTAPASSPGVAALGQTLALPSKILGETRVINVYLPPDYATSGERYPVLYMPDGGMTEDFPHVVGSVDVSIKNGIVRPVIVVGVQNTERRRDLVGPTTIPSEMQAAPHAGGNTRFRAFLRDELKPMIAARYRTTAESALVGESLAGLFVIETLLVEPTLFDGYIAADPSLQWNDYELARTAAARTAWLPAGRTLYVATADEPMIHQGVDMLVSALRIQAPPLTWRYEPMPEEHHGTIFPTAALHGIRMLFAAPGTSAAP